MNTSNDLILKLINGSRKEAMNINLTFVDVRDVALSHIAVYENSGTEGRHLCISESASYIDICDRLRTLFPQYATQIPSKVAGYDERPLSSPTKFSNKKLTSYPNRVHFRGLDTMLFDTVSSLEEKGFLKPPSKL